MDEPVDRIRELVTRGVSVRYLASIMKSLMLRKVSFQRNFQSALKAGLSLLPFLVMKCKCEGESSV